MVFFNAAKGVYYCSYRDGVHRRQFSCKTKNRRLAEKYALEHIRAISSEPPLKSVEEDRPEQKLSEFMCEYMSAVQSTLKPSSLRIIKGSFRQLIARVGDINISDLTLAKAEKFIMTGQPSLFSARRHYGHLKSAFRWGVERKLIDANPFSFNKPKQPPHQIEFLRPEEFELLIKRLPDSTFRQRRFKRFIIVAFETGLRLTELLNLRKQWLHPEKGLLVVLSDYAGYRTKSDKSRAVPLSDKAWSTIQAQLEDNGKTDIQAMASSPHVFCGKQGQALYPTMMQQSFKAASRAVFPGREKLRFHSLRHSFGSRLASAGVPLQEIQKAMGHSVISMTEKYVHLDMEVYTFIPDVLNKK